MIEHTLKRLGIPPSTDYVKAFEEFVRWAAEGRQDYIVRRRRAAAAFRLGDYATALHDARWCVLQRPQDPQANVLEGLAAVGAVATDILPIGLLGAGGAAMAESPASLLAEARRSFQRTLQADPDNAAARLASQAVVVMESMAPPEAMVCGLAGR